MRIVTEDHGWWLDGFGRRHTEWSAVDDDSYGGPGSPIGTGATEAEAIADLLALIEDA
jgi:hypothetical protein